MRCLAQGHLDAQLGGAGDGTINLLVKSEPALPHEVHAPSISIDLLVLTVIGHL